MKDKKSHVVIIVLGIAALYLLYTRYKASSVSASTAPTNTAPAGQTGVMYGAAGAPNFTTPYLQPTPGVSDSVVNMFGNSGQPFQSDITVNLTTNPFSQLTQKYIPLYGFVGMAAP